MQTNKKSISCFVLASLLPLFLSCKAQTGAVYSGLWVMSDTPKMKVITGYSGKEFGSYCLEFRPEAGKAYVRFLYNPQIYEFSVRELAKDRFGLNDGKHTREVFIRGAYSEYSKKTEYYWHFMDSTPDIVKAQSYDGVLSDFKTQDECIKDLQEQYEFDSNEPVNQDSSVPAQ